VEEKSDHKIGAVGLDHSKTTICRNGRFLRSCPPSRPSDRTLGFFAFCLLLLCPAFSYAENPSVINLSAISIDESNNKSVIGDKHLKNKAYGIYQIRLPLLTDYNRANGTRLKVEQMLDPKTSQKVAEWAFNSYYPRILKAKGHKPSRIALLTCWNMGQGSFFLGKRASSYESKYLKALQKTKTTKRG